MLLQQELPESDEPPVVANAWVYDVFEGGVLVYVGLSINPEKRLQQHIKVGKISKGASVRRVSFHETWGPAHEAETRRIQELLPPKNIMGKKLSNDEAYKIWTDAKLSQKEKLNLMWGWSKQSAISAFTRRMIADGLLPPTD